MRAPFVYKQSGCAGVLVEDADGHLVGMMADMKIAQCVASTLNLLFQRGEAAEKSEAYMRTFANREYQAFKGKSLGHAYNRNWRGSAKLRAEVDRLWSVKPDDPEATCRT